MLKTTLAAVLPFLVFFGSGPFKTSLNSLSIRDTSTGMVEKMIVSAGNASIDVDVNRLNGARSEGSVLSSVRFETQRDAFFTIVVFNGELRGPMPGSLPIRAISSASLPSKLGSSLDSLVLDHNGFTSHYELSIRDLKSGFTFFNIEGHLYDYDPRSKTFSIQMGRLLVSPEFAAELGQPGLEGALVGLFSASAVMRTVEATRVSEDGIEKGTLPAADPSMPGTVPGPDVVVGDVNGLAQFGSSSGTQVGLALGTDSCNFGTIDLNWFALPSNDHPVIPQNLYRMSGGADNAERFEQIGQSQMKHGFTALTQNICSLGCNGVGGTRLGSGCSDPYSASLNAGPNLGSRAWVNPFTGFFPRGDSATPPNVHTGHTHTGPSHRILTEINDLATNLNPGATYYAEGQYVTPHEYAWCQANPGQCNMNNNVSYRRYNVTGTASPFSFSPVGSTVRAKAAITAWTGSSQVEINPAPGVDGIGIVAYKVTNPSPGVWRYEYAIYNQNMDRGISLFTVPVGSDATVSNVGFKSPPQHPGWSGDGTVGNAGYSSAPWAVTQSSTSVSWASETFAQNQNANAIRWGTLYNFRFESNRPPATVNATIGFYKTGNPIVVQVQAPSGPAAQVSVGGRVTNAAGQPVYLARVTMTDTGGNVRTAITNPFGYYRFTGVSTGAVYTMAANAKGLTFTSQNVPVNGGITDLNFVANP